MTDDAADADDPDGDAADARRRGRFEQLRARLRGETGDGTATETPDEVAGDTSSGDENASEDAGDTAPDGVDDRWPAEVDPIPTESTTPASPSTTGTGSTTESDPETAEQTEQTEQTESDPEGTDRAETIDGSRMTTGADSEDDADSWEWVHDEGPPEAGETVDGAPDTESDTEPATETDVEPATEPDTAGEPGDAGDRVWSAGETGTDATETDAVETRGDVPADAGESADRTSTGRIWDDPTSSMSATTDTDSAMTDTDSSPRDTRSVDADGSDESGGPDESTETRSSGLRETTEASATETTSADSAAADSGAVDGEPTTSMAGDRDSDTDHLGESLADATDASVPTGPTNEPRSESVPELPAFDALEPGSSALVLSPLSGPLSTAACGRLLDAGEGAAADAVGSGPADEDAPAGPRERNVLLVAVEASAAERIDVCHRAGIDAGEIAAIEVGSHGGSRSVASETTGGGQSVSVTRVSRPGNLSKLGILITKQLSEWESDGRPIVFCLHSLTALQQAVSDEKLFRFLHVLTRRLAASGCRAHFHMDPDAHHEMVVGTVRPIFDVVVRIGPNGTVDVDRE
ncbi:hypothetical protein [Halopenitus sp. POP-27]|uniref:DUF7504 family protein n=1 Tax=Halopenitus sp. POP-27 TaxID=2994425 RepID=UPI0024691989|nr:hypothetical protein [Halopenitus sp. POP-27]